MSTPGLLRSSSTRSVKKLEKPRPLKISGNQNRNSTAEISPRYSIGSWDDLMLLVDNVSQCIANQNFEESLFLNIVTMSSSLKMYGQQLESVYKDQLDRAFVIFRNGCGNDRVNYFCRLYLLELIELRANQWLNCDNICSYYNTKMATPDSEPLATTPDALSSGVGLINLSATSPMNTTVLSPGEVLKASGKFPKPTKIPGKNYCKDEVVIRNSDSGKVMGIKGRRVHMIEELSETIISFQRGFVRPMIIKSPFTWTTARPHYPDYHYVHPNIPQCWVPSMKVNPGAKERLVQITGPTEDKITHARQLMEDTIRRNASPVREVVEHERMGGSSSSLNSSASDESNRLPQTGIRPKTLLHSFSTNDANIGEYKYTVTLGNETIKITGKNLELVRNAKLILEEYYNDWSRRNDNGDSYRPGDEDVFMSPSAAAAGRYVGSYDSGNGNPSTSTSGESDDITCISALPNSIAIPGTRNLDYSATQQQSYPGSHPERRAVLGRSVSLYTNNHLLPYSSSYEDTVGTSRVYSRDFLLECSMSHLSKLVPPGWERITKEFPAIVKKMTSPFDPKAFAKSSIESCLATSVISSTFNTETGSPESD